MLANDGGSFYDPSMTDEKTEAEPQPPRKRWRKTKWSYGIVLTYCAATIATMVWWAGYSHAKFDETVAPIATIVLSHEWISKGIG